MSGSEWDTAFIDCHYLTFIYCAFAVQRSLPPTHTTISPQLYPPNHNHCDDLKPPHNTHMEHPTQKKQFNTYSTLEQGAAGTYTAIHTPCTSLLISTYEHSKMYEYHVQWKLRANNILSTLLQITNVLCRCPNVHMCICACVHVCRCADVLMCICAYVHVCMCACPYGKQTVLQAPDWFTGSSSLGRNA